MPARASSRPWRSTMAAARCCSPASMLERARPRCVSEQVRGQRGQGPRLGRQRLGQGEPAGLVVEGAAGAQGLEQAVALGRQGLAVAPGVHQRRVVRQHGQQRALGPRQAFGRPAEPAPRGGVEADDVSPEGRVGGKEGEDRLLVLAHLQAQGEEHLDELLADRARPRGPREADHLHGEGARPADHAARRAVLADRPRHGQRVDAGVAVEAPVLELHEGAAELLGDLRAGGEAPLAVGGDRGAQQLAAARQEHRRVRPAQRAPAGARREPSKRDRAGDARSEVRARCRRGRPRLSGVGTTRIHRPAVLAFTVGSYIASTLTRGR